MRGILTSCALALLCVPALVSQAAAVDTCSGTGAAFAGGSGTSADPYLMSNAGQLAAMGTSTYRTCAFRQTQDIALSGEWTPIGPGGGVFTGQYDGGGHTISGIRITGASDFAGLIGYSGDGAVFRNMVLEGTIDAPNASSVGALVGFADRPTTVINVHSSVDVTARSTVGGVVGASMEAAIERSSSTGDVTGTYDSVGGLVGRARGAYGGVVARVTDSYARGRVMASPGSSGVGGLIGSIQDGTPGVVVERSYAAGAMAGGTGTREVCDEDPVPPVCTDIPGTTGGLIAPWPPGTTYNYLSVTTSFWDAVATGRATTADDAATPLNTTEMKSPEPFRSAGWDISNGWSRSATWGICEGTTYPFLNSQYAASPCPSTPVPAPGPAGAAPSTGPPQAPARRADVALSPAQAARGIPVSAAGTLSVPIGCPADGPQCVVSASLITRPRTPVATEAGTRYARPRVLCRVAGIAIPPGGQRAVAMRIRASAMRQYRRQRVQVVGAVLVVGNGPGAATHRTLRLRMPLPGRASAVTG